MGRVVASSELRRGAVLTTSDALAWLERLRLRCPACDPSQPPAPTGRRSRGGQRRPPLRIYQPPCTRCLSAISDFRDDHWFARTLGFDCVDGNGDSDSSLADVLQRRIGKPQLDGMPDGAVDGGRPVRLHRGPTRHRGQADRGWFHSYSSCGWHPADYDRASGRALYRWRINEVLDASTLGLRLADEGEDIGRMVHVLPRGLDELVVELADVSATGDPRVPHAINVFRRHGATREDRRDAVRGLADTLEANRRLLKAELLSNDEGALFQIANNFDIRHHRADQKTNYPDEYLDWLFHWYLATIDLARRISQRMTPPAAGPD